MCVCVCAYALCIMCMFEMCVWVCVEVCEWVYVEMCEWVCVVATSFHVCLFTQLLGTNFHSTGRKPHITAYQAD